MVQRSGSLGGCLWLVWCLFFKDVFGCFWLVWFGFLGVCGWFGGVFGFLAGLVWFFRYLWLVS